MLQNLSVLTRGNTLKHRVCLLGGPNTYLPFLQSCWRQRIPEVWQERGYEWPQDVPIDELVFVPDNAQYYAAFGACVYGMGESATTGLYKGMASLVEYMTNGRKARLAETAGPPLVEHETEVHEFTELYKIPKFVPMKLEKGQKVRAVIGVDGGSTSSKAVLVDENQEIICKAYQLSARATPSRTPRSCCTKLKSYVTDCGAELDIIGVGATGYAADVLENSMHVDVNIVETVAHMMSAVKYCGDIDVVCDIGGQDIKVLFIKNGDIQNFRLSNSCSAGNGMLLQAMADQFGLPVTEYAETAFKAELAPIFSYGCAVFLDTDRVNFQKEGFSKEELLAGLAQVLPKNVWQYVVQIPRLAALGSQSYVLQGGTQYNLAAVKAQVDYIKQRVPDAEVFVHPHTGEAGALGAAFEALRVVKRRGKTRRSSASMPRSTSNTAPRTTKRPSATSAPTSASAPSSTPSAPTAPPPATSPASPARRAPSRARRRCSSSCAERKAIAKQYPNLVSYEASKAFKHFYQFDAAARRRHPHRRRGRGRRRACSASASAAP